MTSLPLPAIRALPTRSLVALLQGLQGGTISNAASTSMIRRAVGDIGEAAAAELTSLFTAGFPCEHVALVLGTLVAERTSAAPRLELVTSGPDPAAITRDTGVVLRELFAGAERRVLVAGFAVYQGREIFSVLAQRMQERSDIAVRLCLDVQRRAGDTTKSDALLRRFAHRFLREEWPGSRVPEVFYDPRSLVTGGTSRASLHAKCVVVDGTRAFIGSANFTEAAQLRNIEVGVVVKDFSVAAAAERHFEALIDHGHLLPLALTVGVGAV